MNYFYNVNYCSEKELSDQITYLKETPVSAIGGYLERGQLTLRKGIIRSLKVLGSLKTEFGQIGTLEPGTRDGAKKFLVSEVVPILRRNAGVDDELLRNIEAFIGKIDEIKFNITTFIDNNDLIVKDGNKRTIAFYEAKKELLLDDIEFHTYIVSR